MESIEQDLGGIRRALEADGYTLRVDGLQAGRLQLSVIAEAGACEECLVPKDLMKAMMQRCLTSTPEVRDICIRYPND